MFIIVEFNNFYENICLTMLPVEKVGLDGLDVATFNRKEEAEKYAREECAFEWRVVEI